MDDAFERLSAAGWVFKRLLADPLANYMPACVWRGLLKFGKSQIAQANWSDAGGWRSMVFSYDGRAPKVADRILLAGVMPKALRNRRRLAVRILRDFIQAGRPPVHLLCLGAGPGHIIMEAMASAGLPSQATLVDLSAAAFEYGQDLAGQHGLSERVRFVVGDVRDVRSMLDRPPDVVKMVGICEYLTDEQIVDVARAVGAVMPAGAPIVFNNLTSRHGNDRFFRRVFGLHMRHRGVQELTGLMRQAGFDGFEAHEEPLGVYSVIVGYRRLPR